MPTYDQQEVLSSGPHDRLALAYARYKAKRDNVAYRATLFLLRTGAIGPVTGEPVEVYVPFETVSEGYLCPSANDMCAALQSGPSCIIYRWCLRARQKGRLNWLVVGLGLVTASGKFTALTFSRRILRRDPWAHQTSNQCKCIYHHQPGSPLPVCRSCSLIS